MAKTEEDVRAKRAKATRAKPANAGCTDKDVHAVVDQVIKRHRGALLRLAKP